MLSHNDSDPVHKIAFCYTPEEAELGTTTGTITREDLGHMQGCRPLTEAEIEDCIKSFGGKYEKRDRALFILGIYTGFRISELLSLKVKDVYQHGRIVDRLSASRHSMKGQYASRSVPIHHHAQLVLNEWIQQMPRFYDVTPETYLICSREGENKPLSRVHAHRILKQIFDSCQMTGTLGTHSMRKTFARRVHINLGGDLAKTRKALGQKNIQSTIHYMSFMDSEIDEAILQQ